MIASNADINHMTNDGWTPLMAAAHNGHATVVSYLLSSGVEVNNTINEEWSRFMTDAQNGHNTFAGNEDDTVARDKFHTVFPHIPIGMANVKHSGKNIGWTALMLAASQGHETVVAQLITSGARVDQESNDGWTALMLAASQGHETVVGQMIAAGAMVDHMNDSGWTPLVVAANNGHSEVVLRLFGAGGNINHENNEGETALFKASQEGHELVVSSLLSSGCDVNHENNEGETALFKASQNGHALVVSSLLSSGCDVNHENNEGETALFLAALTRNENLVRLLIERNADPCGIKKNDKNAQAFFYIPKTIIDMLLAAGMPPFSENELQQTKPYKGKINIGLALNARGKICMVYDNRFYVDPLWVAYHIDKKQLEIVFDEGSTYLIDWVPTDVMHYYLLKINKILLIRMENDKPVEGFDISLLRVMNGKVIEEDITRPGC